MSFVRSAPARIAAAALSLAACATLLAAAPPAAAQIVFDNGAPDGSGAFFSDPSRSQYAADTFTFESTTTFDTVIWFGIYAPSNTPTFPDAFTISFHNTTGGAPDAAARAGQTFNIGNTATRTPTGGTNFGFTSYQYSSALSAPLTFGAGTYGISIINDTAADTDDVWQWSRSNTSGTAYLRFSPDDGFSSYEGDVAFSLSNSAAAPEPGSVALVLVGFASVVARRRGKAQSV